MPLQQQQFENVRNKFDTWESSNLSAILDTSKMKASVDLKLLNLCRACQVRPVVLILIVLTTWLIYLGSQVVVKYIQRPETPTKIIKGVSEPWGVAVRSNGEIVVAEWGDHCVSIFDHNGKKIRTFGTYGSALGQFNHSCGVAIDSTGNILVADKGNHRIQMFTAEGEFLKAVGGKGSEQLSPTGIGINHKNKKVYICDNSNHQVQILNDDLTFFRSFGSRGSGEGLFNYPWDVAFDSTGNVYIVDSSNHCIQVFTPEGRFVRKFGKEGSGKGELKWPSSVSIDSNDIVYVADKDNHRVSIFTRQGDFVRSFGIEGAKPGEFNQPWAVTVDCPLIGTSGLLYVSDKNNNRVQIFQMSL